ncbi:hypothetical protein Bbelb_419540, partial [Branchiostoma belcheri]
ATPAQYDPARCRTVRRVLLTPTRRTCCPCTPHARFNVRRTVSDDISVIGLSHCRSPRCPQCSLRPSLPPPETTAVRIGQSNSGLFHHVRGLPLVLPRSGPVARVLTDGPTHTPLRDRQLAIPVITHLTHFHGQDELTVLAGGDIPGYVHRHYSAVPPASTQSTSVMCLI